MKSAKANSMLEMSRKHWSRLKNNDFMRLSLYQAVQGTHTDELYKLKVK